MVNTLSMMCRPLFLLVFGFFILPFIFSPGAEVPFEVPRVWVVLIWIELLGVVSIFTFLKQRTYTKLKLSTVWLLITFFFLAVISSVLAGGFQHSFYGNYYRFDGLVTLAHLILFSIWVALFFDKKWIRFFLWPVGGSVLILSVFTIFQGLWQFPLPISLSFGLPNFLAGYLLVGIPAAMYFVKQFPKRFEKPASTLIFFLVTLAITFTQSAAGVLGIVLFVVLIWLGKDRAKMNWIFPSMFIFLFIFISLSYFYFKDSYVAESRERIVRKLWPAISQKPVMGWGWGNVDQAFQSTIWPMEYQHDIHVDKAHSLILESFVTTGILGGVLYCLILYLTGKTLLHNASSSSASDKVILIMFALFVYHSQTNVISTSEEIIFWFFVGMSMQKTRVGVELKGILR